MNISELRHRTHTGEPSQPVAPSSIPTPQQLTPTPTANFNFTATVWWGCEQITDFYNYWTEFSKDSFTSVKLTKLKEHYKTNVIIDWIEKDTKSVQYFLPEIKKLSDVNKIKVAEKLLKTKLDYKTILNDLLPTFELSKGGFLHLFGKCKSDKIPHKYIQSLELNPEEELSLLKSLADWNPSTVHLHVGFFKIDSGKRLEVFLKSVKLNIDPNENRYDQVKPGVDKIKFLSYYNLDKADYLRAIYLFASILDQYTNDTDKQHNEFTKTLITYSYPTEYKFDVAKIFSACSPRALQFYPDIDSFSQVKKIELFEAALENKNAVEAFKFYSQYKIDDKNKNAVIEKASDLAPLELLSNSENFPLKDDDQRCNVLCNGAMNFPRETAEQFEQLGQLKKESDRFLVARGIAERDAKAIAVNIQDFTLSEPKSFEIAKIGVEKNPAAVMEYLYNFNLSLSHFNTIRERAIELLK